MKTWRQEIKGRNFAGSRFKVLGHRPSKRTKDINRKRVEKDLTPLAGNRERAFDRDRWIRP